MPRDKFKLKDFDSYVREDKDYPNIGQMEDRIEIQRPQYGEGEFLRSPTDVRDDYWNDVRRAKEESPRETHKQRPLKRPKRMLRKWDARKAKRRNSSRG